MGKKLLDQGKTHRKELAKFELKYENDLAKIKSTFEEQTERGFEAQIKELKEKALAQINRLEEERDQAEAKTEKLGAQMRKMSANMQEASEEREKAIKRANQAVNEPKTSL